MSGDSSENLVHLVGRVSGPPEDRVLPSGDEIWTFRVVVARREPRGRQTVDALECVAWSGRARRSVATWRDGDVVRVEGSLRRRFYRAGGATHSRVEVRAERVRLIRRAAIA